MENGLQSRVDLKIRRRAAHLEKSLYIAAQHRSIDITKVQPGMSVVIVRTGGIQVEADITDGLRPGSIFKISIFQRRLHREPGNAGDDRIQHRLSQAPGTHDPGSILSVRL